MNHSFLYLQFHLFLFYTTSNTHTHTHAHTHTGIASAKLKSLWVSKHASRFLSCIPFLILSPLSEIPFRYPQLSCLSLYPNSFFKAGFRNIFLLKEFPDSDLPQLGQVPPRKPRGAPSVALPTQTRRGGLCLSIWSHYCLVQLSAR